jgi:peptidoglycan/xylan/chitin deacetylase (PgdA/CDA1 family)
MYHSFAQKNVFFNVLLEDFKQQIDYLIDHEYKIISLSELIRKIKTKESLIKCIVLSFDDGHKDFVNEPYLFLKEKKLPAVLFWPSGMPNNLLVASDQTRCPLLNNDEINLINADNLVELGSHTVTHRQLTDLKKDELVDEIRNSLIDIRKISFKQDISFAYPRGKYNKFIVNEVKDAGYLCACTAYPAGVVSHSSDLYLLPRIFLGKPDDMVSFQIKLSRFFVVYSAFKANLNKLIYLVLKR